MIMKRIVFLLLLAATPGGKVTASPVPTNTVGEARILLIEPSSMPVLAGEATLTIGALGRTNGTYTGDYRVKVFPYFYKSEKGRLAMLVSDAALAEIRAGKVTPITGTATTSGKRGRCRRIDAIVTPKGRDKGMLKVSFLAGGRDMIFEPTYRIVKTMPKEAVGLAAEALPTTGMTGFPEEAKLNTGPTAGTHL